MQAPSSQSPVNTRFIDAAACGCTHQIQYAISLQAGIDATDSQGNSALHVAAMYGHADAVLVLEQKIQPALRNREGKTCVEVWCSKLPPPHPPYPSFASAQRSRAERHRCANALSDKLADHLRLPSGLAEWGRYLLEWKAVGRLDTHANAVLFGMMSVIQSNSASLTEFSDENYLHSLSMLFEVLASFAQESFCFLVTASQSGHAPAVINEDDQLSALRVLSSMETMFEATINKKLLGVELFTSLQLLSHAIQSFSLAASGATFGKANQRKLQQMGFELMLSMGCLIGCQFGDLLSHGCNLACLILSEVSACESNDWMTAVIEMNLASLGCQHTDLSKAETSFQILQKHVVKYTSFFKRQYDLLLQAVLALYRVARFSPHASIRLRAALGRSQPHSPKDHSPPRNAVPSSFNASLQPGDEVYLQRHGDSSRSTRLRKTPSTSRDDSVWLFPTVEIHNKDTNCIVTFLRQVPAVSARGSDDGVVFALVRVQAAQPSLSEFSRSSGGVHAVEGYVQLQYLRRVMRDDESRNKSPSPPPECEHADEERSSMVISIKTLTTVSCFFRSFKNDRVRALSALMMLRLHYNLSTDGSNIANNTIVSESMEVIDAACCSRNFHEDLKADLRHLRQLRRPGHSIVSSALHGEAFDPIDDNFSVNASASRMRQADSSRVPVGGGFADASSGAPPPRLYLQPRGSSPPGDALLNARQLWQACQPSSSSAQSAAPAAPPTASPLYGMSLPPVGPSAPPPDDQCLPNQAFHSEPSYVQPSDLYWQQLPAGWIRCYDVQGKFCYRYAALALQTFTKFSST
jgi:hypothetical protein